MKFLVFIQSYAAMVGVEPGEKKMFNRQNVEVLFFLGLSLISCLVFMLTENSTFIEYAKSFFVVITLLATYVGFLNMTMQSMILVQLLKKVEKSIDNRK